MKIRIYITAIVEEPIPADRINNDIAFKFIKEHIGEAFISAEECKVNIKVEENL